MAVSKQTYCHDLLHRWQVRMQENIWNFNQVRDDSFSKTFDGVYVQDDRETIAHALTEAFESARYYLGYYPQPTYVENEIIYLNEFEYFESQVLSLDTRHLVNFGTRATTLIESDASITYSDNADADAIHETATITVSTSVTDTSEIQVFYRVSDGAPSAAHKQWRIPTQTISISSGTATITIHRANLASPTLWLTQYNTDETRNEGDISNGSSDFVTAVDVYRVYTDSTNAVKVLSEPTSSDDYTVNETTVNPVILDAFETRFKVKTSSNVALSNTPYAVKVSYQAGLALNNGLMNQAIEQAIIRLANTNRSLSSNPMSHHAKNMWKFDREELFVNNVPFNQLQDYMNPLGTRRGHLEAWIVFKRLADSLTGMV